MLRTGTPAAGCQRQLGTPQLFLLTHLTHFMLGATQAFPLLSCQVVRKTARQAAGILQAAVRVRSWLARTIRGQQYAPRALVAGSSERASDGCPLGLRSRAAAAPGPTAPMRRLVLLLICACAHYDVAAGASRGAWGPRLHHATALGNIAPVAVCRSTRHSGMAAVHCPG